MNRFEVLDVDHITPNTRVRVQAQCHIARNDAAAAFDAIDKARSVIAQTGAKLYLGELHERCAEYAGKFHQRWQRAEQLALARQHYAAIGSVAHVARIEKQEPGS